MTSRFKWVTYDGKPVLKQDFSGLSRTELQSMLKESHEQIRSKGQRGIVVITNIKDIRFDRETTRELENLSIANKSYVKESAIFGVGALQKVALESIARLTGRKFTVFKEETEVQDWIRSLN